VSVVKISHFPCKMPENGVFDKKSGFRAWFRQ
jgi:hypothetical protein